MGNDFMENGGECGSIVPDRAGGTSHGSGKPPANVFYAHESYGPFVKSLETAGFVDARTGETARTLERIPYSHLAYYFRVALSESNPHDPSVKTVHDLVIFDRRFQSVAFKYIGAVESQLRAQYSHLMKVAFGDFPHYDESVFTDAKKYEQSFRAYEADAAKSKRNNVVIRDIASNNGGKIPIGYAVQVMSLGVLSRMYANTADTAVTQKVASSFGSTWSELTGWLRAVSDVRNICAHYGAYLSRKQMPTTPKKIKGLESDNSRPPYIACLLAYLLSNGDSFGDRNLDYASCMVKELCGVVLGFQLAYPELAREMGFGDDWASQVKRATEIGAQNKLSSSG